MPVGLFDTDDDMCPECGKIEKSEFTYMDEPYPHYICPNPDCPSNDPMRDVPGFPLEDTQEFEEAVTTGSPMSTGVNPTSGSTIVSPTEHLQATKNIIGDELGLDDNQKKDPDFLKNADQKKLDGLINALGSNQVNQSTPLNTGAMGTPGIGV